MNPYAWAVVVIVGALCTCAGMIIAYYKAKAEFEVRLARRMAAYITKEDCKNCSIKADLSELCTILKEHSKDLRDGTKAFEALRLEIALIKQRLPDKNDPSMHLVWHEVSSTKEGSPP